VDIEVDSLHIKRIAIDNLVSYVYIVRVDKNCFSSFHNHLSYMHGR
jgi:hypothetical protein